MTTQEALKIANDMVESWTGAVRNERGYVHDKWAPINLIERTRAVLELAEFLVSDKTALDGSPSGIGDPNRG